MATASDDALPGEPGGRERASKSLSAGDASGFEAPADGVWGRANQHLEAAIRGSAQPENIPIPQWPGKWLTQFRPKSEGFLSRQTGNASSRRTPGFHRQPGTRRNMH